MFLFTDFIRITKAIGVKHFGFKVTGTDLKKEAVC